MPIAAATCARVMVVAVGMARYSAGSASKRARARSASRFSRQAGLGSRLRARANASAASTIFPSALEHGAEHGERLRVGAVELDRAPGVLLGGRQRVARALDVRQLAKKDRARRRNLQRALDDRLRLGESSRGARVRGGRQLSLDDAEPDQPEAGGRFLTRRIDRQQLFEGERRREVVAERERGLHAAFERREIPPLPESAAVK